MLNKYNRNLIEMTILSMFVNGELCSLANFNKHNNIFFPVGTDFAFTQNRDD